MLFVSFFFVVGGPESVQDNSRNCPVSPNHESCLMYQKATLGANKRSKTSEPWICQISIHRTKQSAKNNMKIHPKSQNPRASLSNHVAPSLPPRAPVLYTAHARCFSHMHCRAFHHGLHAGALVLAGQMHLHGLPRPNTCKS